jgi:hypothetical protein
MIKTGLAALGLTAATAFPAFAEACRPAAELEQQLAKAATTPFLAAIKPEMAKPGWNIGAWGGFEVAAPGLGEVDRLNAPMGEALTTCGLRLTWRTYWGGRGVESAGVFRVTPQADAHAARSSLKYSATTFRVFPDPGSQTAWLTVTEGGTSWNYLLDFPATAISTTPGLHGSYPRLELMGVRANGVLVYAEFSMAPARR